MDYKKKYEEALGRAKKYYNRELYAECNGSLVEDIFPELKESEDERVRKWLIEAMKYLSEESTFFYKVSKDEVLAWLENVYTKDDINRAYKCADEVQYRMGYEAAKQELEKQEPKFKVGDWITNSIETVQITGYDIDYGYQVDFGGNLQHRDTDIIEKEYHLWTINNAKDGDMISFNDGHGTDCIELIKSITGEKIEFWFCLINGNHYEVFDGITPYTNFASREDATPATIEQRDTLIKAIADAGYEWDEDKLELREIEQKPTWSEEDERMCTLCASSVKTRYIDGLLTYNEYEQVSLWLESLKERMKGE